MTDSGVEESIFRELGIPIPIHPEDTDSSSESDSAPGDESAGGQFCNGFGNRPGCRQARREALGLRLPSQHGGSGKVIGGENVEAGDMPGNMDDNNRHIISTRQGGRGSGLQCFSEHSSRDDGTSRAAISSNASVQGPVSAVNKRRREGKGGSGLRLLSEGTLPAAATARISYKDIMPKFHSHKSSGSQVAAKNHDRSFPPSLTTATTGTSTTASSAAAVARLKSVNVSNPEHSSPFPAVNVLRPTQAGGLGFAVYGGSDEGSHGDDSHGGFKSNGATNVGARGTGSSGELGFAVSSGDGPDGSDGTGGDDKSFGAGAGVDRNVFGAMPCPERGSVPLGFSVYGGGAGGDVCDGENDPGAAVKVDVGTGARIGFSVYGHYGDDDSKPVVATTVVGGGGGGDEEACLGFAVYQDKSDNGANAAHTRDRRDGPTGSPSFAGRKNDEDVSITECSSQSAFRGIGGGASARRRERWSAGKYMSVKEDYEHVVGKGLPSTRITVFSTRKDLPADGENSPPRRKDLELKVEDEEVVLMAEGEEKGVSSLAPRLSEKPFSSFLSVSPCGLGLPLLEDSFDETGELERSGGRDAGLAMISFYDDSPVSRGFEHQEKISSL